MTIHETISELRNILAATVEKTTQSQQELKPKVQAMHETNIALLAKEQKLQRQLELVFNELDVIEKLESLTSDQRLDELSQKREKALDQAVEVGVDSLKTYYSARTHDLAMNFAELGQQIRDELAAKSRLANQSDLSNEALAQLKLSLLATVEKKQQKLNDVVDMRIALMTQVSQFHETQVWLNQLDARCIKGIAKYINTPAAACELGNLELIKQCVEQGAAQLASELLPIASLYGHEDIVDYLLIQGAEPRQLDAHGYSAWHRASQNGNIAILTKFWQAEQQKKNLEQNKPKQNFTLFGKKKNRCITPADSTTCLDIKGEADRTPLSVAVYYGRAATVNWLLNQGADAKVVDRFGRNLLHIAAEKGHADLIGILLNASVNPLQLTQARDIRETPLLTAALYGKVEVLVAFADHNLNLQSTELQGLKPRDFSQVIRVLAEANQQRLLQLQTQYQEYQADQDKVPPLKLVEGYFLEDKSLTPQF
jgi:ankyrin repeat protein